MSNTDSAIGRSTRLPVLVFVDDDEATRVSLRNTFRGTGYSMYAFPDGPGALEFIARVAADLVIADFQMPGMTGFELLGKVSEVNPGAIRIILSQYEEREAVLQMQPTGIAQHHILKPWNDVLVRDLVHQALVRKEGVRRQRLEEILGSLDALPSPPSFHEQLQATLARDGSSVRDISREIEKSPPIVARLLRASNSVYFARRKSIMTVYDAVFLVGTEYIAGLVSAIEAFQGFAAIARPEFIPHLEDLWVSSFKRATIAKKIAEKWASGLDVSGTLYIASLLQDIGYAIVLSFDPDLYAEYLKRCEAGTRAPHEAEQALFEYRHDVVGAALLEHWSLPQTIVSTVEKHHQKSEGDVFVQILQIADLLCPGMRSTVHDPIVDDMVTQWKVKLRNELEAIIGVPAGAAT
jgi:HD-like signal output (HDOD) protein